MLQDACFHPILDTVYAPDIAHAVSARSQPPAGLAQHAESEAGVVHPMHPEVQEYLQEYRQRGGSQDLLTSSVTTHS